MSETYITVRGYAANRPELRIVNGKNPMAVFRIGVNPRYFDRAKGQWVDGQTEWYSIMSFGNLAQNVSYSINKGDPVVVYGRFRTSQWQPNENERPYISLEIVAASVGHDMRFGQTKYARTRYEEENRESATENGELGEANRDENREEVSDQSGGSGADFDADSMREPDAEQDAKILTNPL